jgi:hypothetical protein
LEQVVPVAQQVFMVALKATTAFLIRLLQQVAVVAQRLVVEAPHH